MKRSIAMPLPQHFLDSIHFEINYLFRNGKNKKKEGVHVWLQRDGQPIIS